MKVMTTFFIGFLIGASFQAYTNTDPRIITLTGVILFLLMLFIDIPSEFRNKKKTNPKEAKDNTDYLTRYSELSMLTKESDGG